MSEHQVINGSSNSKRRPKVDLPVVTDFKGLPLDQDERAQALHWFSICLRRLKTVGHFSEVVQVTPILAQILLDRNKHNRALVEAGVKDLCDTLRAGDWEINGEAIIVSDTGELNDGQHRLTAVVRTGISISTFISFGVGRESRKTVDIGRKRNAGHVLAMAGVSNAPLVAVSAKIHLNMRSGIHLTTHRSTKEIERELQEFPDLATYRSTACKMARQYHQSTGLMAVLHCLASRIHGPEKADEFYEAVYSGLGITDPKHPAFVLRKRLTDNLGNKAKLPVMEVAVLTIKAWNAFADNKSVAALRWITQGAAPEPFPAVR